MKPITTGKSRLFITSVFVALLCMMFVLTVFASQERYQLGETEKTWWSGTTVANWRKVEKAKKYQVRLYEDGTSVFYKTVESTSVDFSEYMEDGSEYYFEVCAYAKNSSQRTGEWVESDVKLVTGRGDLSGNFRSYQQGRKYQKRDGTYVTDTWYLIAGEWYCFNADGYARTGWVDTDGIWYYLDNQGVMQKGWLTLDGSSYYMRSDGSMAVGWVEMGPGEWYYLNSDGKMAVNTVVDGCQLDGSGLYIPQ